MKPLDYGSRKQKYETRQTPIATNTLNNAPTHQPIHPRCATAIQQSTADALMTQTEFCSDTGISMFLRLSATPGSEQTLPREAPARRVVHRRPFSRRHVIGLLCGKGVEPPRGRGRPSGARESQVFWGYIITKTFQRSIWTSLLLPLPSSIIS